MVEVKRTDIKIKSDPQKVIPIFLDLNKKKRITGIISNVASLDDNEVEKILNQVLNEFENRHIDFKDVILNHFQNRQVKVAIPKNLSVSKKLLIGAYFTKEYSIESAALFNPSIVVHPSQKGSNSNDMKFVMSLRATGEGHISSIVFRTGMLLQDGRIVLDKEADKLVAAKKITMLFIKRHLSDKEHD